LSAALLALAATGAASTTECIDVRPAELELRLSIDPTAPWRGDLVDLDVEIVNINGGLAAIPLFRLLGAEPLFAIEAQETSYPAVEFARYRLRAVHGGQAALRLLVNYETSDGCVDLPIVFQSVSSGPLAVAVRGGASTPSPTPTATPSP
jgi:hypothetical protein